MADDDQSDVVLLSGGNPQIPKGDGDAPVQSYISAMPDWKGTIGRHVDDLVVETVPHVRKAVRWNTPFYGTEGNGWFLSMHCFTKYVKVTWLNCAHLEPAPPVASKYDHVRSLHIGPDDDTSTTSSRTGSDRPHPLPATTSSDVHDLGPFDDDGCSVGGSTGTDAHRWR